MNRAHLVIAIFLLTALAGYGLSFSRSATLPIFPTGAPPNSRTDLSVTAEVKASFDFLSTNGNSNCSQAFRDSIPGMTDTMRLQGSCCGPMDLARYDKQLTELKKYQVISEITANPYDISAGLAKELLGYDQSIVPTSSEQQILIEGAANSAEKGFCCCRCWRWYVHEGMAKFLVHNKGFTAQQITDVLNLEDGCGGPAADSS